MEQFLQQNVTHLSYAGALTLAQLAQALPLKVVMELHSSLSLLGAEGVAACYMALWDPTVFWK